MYGLYMEITIGIFKSLGMHFIGRISSDAVLLCNLMCVSIGLHGELMLLTGCKDNSSFY